MLDFPRWKVWSIWAVVLLGVLFAIPSLLPSRAMQYWPSWLPSAQISLGLDLAGGSQLLLEADRQDLMKQRLQTMEDTVATEMRRGDPPIQIANVSTSGGRVTFEVRDPRQVDAAVERMRTITQPIGLTGTRDWEVGVVDLNRVVLTPTPSGNSQALRNAMSVARDVVRRRIDPQGT